MDRPRFIVIIMKLDHYAKIHIFGHCFSTVCRSRTLILNTDKRNIFETLKSIMELEISWYYSVNYFDFLKKCIYMINGYNDE